MKNSTKLLRFRYMLPLSLLIMFDLILIAYAAIVWDNDPSDIWHGPKMPSPYNDKYWDWHSNGWDDSYECPPTPAPTRPPPTPCPTPCPGGGTGSPTDPPTDPPTNPPLPTTSEADVDDTIN